MIKIYHNNKTYKISKSKLLYVLSKLKNSNAEENEIELLMKEYNLYDDYFLKTINKI